MCRYLGERTEVKALVEFLSKSKQELWAWHENLSPALRVDPTNTGKLYVPAVLQLQLVERPHNKFDSP